MSENRVFKSFKELGAFLQKKRRLKGEKIDFISSNLIIKKQFLKNIEEAYYTEKHFTDNPHLKGFLNSYIRYLKLENDCKIDNLFYESENTFINKKNVSIEVSTEKRNSNGSLIILISFILVGSLYLLWNKNTYQQLYNLGEILN